jgi:hypothetical protein
MMNYMNSLDLAYSNVPNTIPTQKTNGDSDPQTQAQNLETEFTNDLRLHNSANAKRGTAPTPTISFNKRKTSKPNQICDFQQEDDDVGYGNEPVDMMIPIKKRRLSTQE